MNWQNMKSAPRDGTPILVFHSRDPEDGSGEITVLCWLEEAEVDDIWALPGHERGCIIGGMCEAWMPLPPPPP